MKIIYKAGDIIEAHIVAGMLNANGIRAYVGGYYLQGGIGELAPLDFANISVADEDVKQALQIVRDYESGISGCQSTFSA
jgi:nitrogen regulatory protein PII-like uncharacterized protein